MRRVSQSRLVKVDESGIIAEKSPDGDCFPACIASIFEIPLGQAPGRRGNTQEVFNWLALNFPGVTCVSRDWVWPPKEPYYRNGYWIATVISSRFRERDCHHCTPDKRRKSKPEFSFWRREECPICDATGHAHGLHAIVMEHAKRAWDPHPEADWDTPIRIVGECYFAVTDPARLVPRIQPAALARAA